MTATSTAPMRLFIDAWDPAYGASGEADEEFTESSASVDVTVELPAERWRPVDPDPAVRPPSAVGCGAYTWSTR